MSRFADFDAAFAEAEARREPLQVRLFGQTWSLPAAMPAAVPLKVARWKAEGRSEDNLTEAELLDFAGDMIPGQVLDAWFAKGLDIEQLGPIVEWVMAQYMEAMPAGEATAPAGASPSSTSPSNGGDSSKPTSPASTALPSLVR